MYICCPSAAPSVDPAIVESFVTLGVLLFLGLVATALSCRWVRSQKKKPQTDLRLGEEIHNEGAEVRVHLMHNAAQRVFLSFY